MAKIGTVVIIYLILPIIPRQIYLVRSHSPWKIWEIPGEGVYVYSRFVKMIKVV